MPMKKGTILGRRGTNTAFSTLTPLFEGKNLLRRFVHHPFLHLTPSHLMSPHIQPQFKSRTTNKYLTQPSSPRQQAVSSPPPSSPPPAQAHSTKAVSRSTHLNRESPSVSSLFPLIQPSDPLPHHLSPKPSLEKSPLPTTNSKLDPRESENLHRPIPRHRLPTSRSYTCQTAIPYLQPL